MAAKARPVGVGVEVGRVRHVVAGALEPPDHLDLPVEELAGAVVVVGPVEGDLHRPPLPRHGRSVAAVEAVEALAAPVVRVVVVGLVGGDAHLVEELGRPVVGDDEGDVVLPAAGVGQDRHVDPARPRVGDRQDVARQPCAGGEAGPRALRARRLLEAGQRAGPEHQPPAEAAVPAQPVEVEREALRRVDRDVERHRLALPDAGCRRVALDLFRPVLRDLADLPARRPGQPVIDHDRVVGHREREGGGDGRAGLQRQAARTRPSAPAAAPAGEHEARIRGRGERDGRPARVRPGAVGATVDAAGRARHAAGAGSRLRHGEGHRPAEGRGDHRVPSQRHGTGATARAAAAAPAGERRAGRRRGRQRDRRSPA